MEEMILFGLANRHWSRARSHDRPAWIVAYAFRFDVPHVMFGQPSKKEDEWIFSRAARRNSAKNGIFVEEKLTSQRQGITRIRELATLLQNLLTEALSLALERSGFDPGRRQSSGTLLATLHHTLSPRLVARPRFIPAR